MTTPINITVLGKPHGWQRTDSKGSQRYTAPKTRSYEKTVADEAALVMKPRQPMDGPVMLNVLAIFPIPVSWSKRKKAAANYVTTKPDADNILKAIADALNGIVYTDDKQVVDTFVRKRYGDQPRVEITVQEMP